MNERIKELLEQATEVYDQWHRGESVCMVDHKMFAELIVQECIEQGKQVQSQTVSNGSEDYNNGRKMGIEVFMNQIKKHFGVEE